MELRQLETFLALSQICNFTKTAQELNYAQSNVSAQIQKLEEELGCPLFDRIGHKVILTKKGRELIPYAKKMISLSQNAKEQLSSHQKRTIHIAASESLCIYELPGLVQQYQKTNPDIELFLQMVNTVDYAELLSHSDVDFAYILDIPITHPAINTLYSVPQPVGLFATPHYSPKHQTNLSYFTCLAELEDERFVLTSQDCCYRRQFAQQMKNIPYTVALETSSLHAIKELTLSGFGICLLPVMAVQKELQNGQLIQLPVTLNITVHSQILMHKDKWIAPQVQDFIDKVPKQPIIS